MVIITSGDDDDDDNDYQDDHHQQAQMEAAGLGPAEAINGPSRRLSGEWPPPPPSRRLAITGLLLLAGYAAAATTGHCDDQGGGAQLTAAHHNHRPARQADHHQHQRHHHQHHYYRHQHDAYHHHHQEKQQIQQRERRQLHGRHQSIINQREPGEAISSLIGSLAQAAHHHPSPSSSSDLNSNPNPNPSSQALAISREPPSELGPSTVNTNIKFNGSLSGGSNTSYNAPDICKPDGDDMVRLSTIIASAIIFLVGFIGNAVVILVILKFTRTATVTDIYILNLALADLMFIVGLIPLITTMANLDWIFGNIMCKLYMAETSLNQFASSLLLVVMSFDRFLAVCHPIYAQRFRRLKTAKSICLAIWIICIVLMTPIVIFAGQYVRRVRPECLDEIQCAIFWPEVTGINLEAGFTLYAFACGFALPLLLIACFYRCVIKRLRLAALGQTSLVSSRRSRSRETTNKRIEHLVIGIICTYTICWAPYWVTQLYVAFSPPPIQHQQAAASLGNSTQASNSTQATTLVNNSTQITTTTTTATTQVAQTTQPAQSAQQEDHGTSFFYAFFLLASCLSYTNSAVNPILYAFLSDNFKRRCSEILRSVASVTWCLRGREMFSSGGENGVSNLGLGSQSQLQASQQQLQQQQQPLNLLESSHPNSNKKLEPRDARSQLGQLRRQQQQHQKLGATTTTGCCYSDAADSNLGAGGGQRRSETAMLLMGDNSEQEEDARKVAHQPRRSVAFETAAAVVSKADKSERQGRG